MLWLVVAVPTPETGSCLRRKRVKKGHSPAPTSGPWLRHPFHNQGSFCWAARQQPFLDWGPERREEIHSRPRPQPTEDPQEWYTRYPVEWEQEKIAGQRWKKGMFLADVGPVSTEVVFCDFSMCVFLYVCLRVSMFL